MVFSLGTILSIVFLLRRISWSVLTSSFFVSETSLSIAFLRTSTALLRSSASSGVLLVEALHAIDEADDAAVRLFLVELVLFVLGVADDVLDADLVVAKPLADVDDLAHGDRAGQDGRENLVFALLDALGDLDFALAGEQRDAAHLAQVHADRVVALVVARRRCPCGARRRRGLRGAGPSSSLSPPWPPSSAAHLRPPPRCGAILMLLASSTISMSSSSSTLSTSSI